MKEDGHVKSEAEMEAVLCKPGGLGRPAAGRGKGASSPRGFGGRLALPTPHF